MPATCKSCKAPIIWAKTEERDGKPSRNMPIDADETGQAAVPGNGNLIIVGYDGDNPIVRYVPQARGMHVSHFATCPNRDEHRKAKR